MSVIVHPNGVLHDLWIKNRGVKSKIFGTFRITAGEGPYGFQITITRAVGDAPFTVTDADESTVSIVEFNAEGREMWKKRRGR